MTKRIVLNIDEEALSLLNKAISMRFIVGINGPCEDMLLSVLSNDSEESLIAGCNGKIVVEATDK